jgi:2-dehydro-3-deoxyphosphooctonate aldolase (KDO 8-P synthase)
MQLSSIPKIKHTDSNHFFLLAGPCAIESEDMALRIAERVIKITDALEIPYVFKGSFKKANRSRIDSFTGIGDEKALEILKRFLKLSMYQLLQTFTKLQMLQKQLNMLMFYKFLHFWYAKQT